MKRIIFCLQDHALFNDDRGLLTPVFEEMEDGAYQAIDPSDFPNNGKIHVTRGYSSVVANTNPSTLFRVETDIATSWAPDEEDSYGRQSKYSTYDKLIDQVKAQGIFQIYEAEYPVFGEQDGLKCSSSTYPVEIFFIQATNPAGYEVLIGPLSLVRGSVEDNGLGYSYNYKGIDKPIGGEWSKLNRIPHSSLEFELELVAETSIISTQYGRYIVGPLPHLSSKVIDLSSNDNLLNWASKLLRSSNSELSDKAGLLKTVAANLGEDSNIPEDIFEERRNRLNRLHERLARMDGFNQVLIDFLSSQEGIKRIESYVDANRDFLLNKYSEELLRAKKLEIEEIIKTEEKQKKKEIEILVQEEKDLTDRVAKLKSTTLSFEQQAIEKKLETLRSEYDLTMTYVDLKGAKLQMEQELEALNKRKGESQELLEEIQRNINRSQKDHKQNLIELKNQLDVLSGYTDTNNFPQISIDKSLKIQVIKSESENDRRREVVESITNLLKDQRRIVSADQISILLTSVLQNLIVTLAGKPGSGKTSIARALAASLGLGQSGRFVDIQVQRGWNSDKDIIGFHNKLTRKYESDKYGLYKLLSELEGVDEDHQLALVLLDEANLSPIEHYWAGFMGVTDGANKKIKLDEKTISVPEGLHFISTVNYDRTTEPLSHRFLDRSPVIYLDEYDDVLDLLDSAEYSDSNELLRYSYKDLQKLFGRTDNAVFSADEKRILEDLMTKHKVLPLRNRKINSIRNFTFVIKGVLESGGGQFLQGLDYAILIHALPLISGQGPDLRKALESLHAYLQDRGLSKSSNRMQSILDNGKFDSYSFFS